MTFLEALKDGRPMRRRDWNAGLAVGWDAARREWYVQQEGVFRAAPYQLDPEHLLAGDWELIPWR